jgi:hypothetical protein
VASKRICEGYVNRLQANPASALGQVSSNDGERRAFVFFRTRTLRRILGERDSEFWSTSFLQLGSAEPAVKHAIVALASLHESLEPVDHFVLARRRGRSAGNNAHVLALEHYNRAIAEIGNLPDSSSHRPDIVMLMRHSMPDSSECRFSASSVVEISYGQLPEAHEFLAAESRDGE